MAEPQSYAELKACLLAWLDDSDANVNVAECIGLAERRLTRLLNVPEMEATTTVEVQAGGRSAFDLPADFYEMRSLTLGRLDYDPVSGTSVWKRLATLEPVSVGALVARYPAATGAPRAYAIQGRTVLLGPVPNADAVTPLLLAYKQAIPALSDGNPTNWLLTKHPDLYVAACLAMAEFRGWNDSRLPMLKSWYDELVDEVNEAGMRARYAVGPMQMRAAAGEAGARRPARSVMQ